jgi:hypothetical protein
MRRNSQAHNKRYIVHCQQRISMHRNFFLAMYVLLCYYADERRHVHEFS